MTPTKPLHSCVITAALLAAFGTSAHAAVTEDFNAATPGSLISTQPGWSYYGGTGNTGSIVTGGYNNTNGLSVPGNGAKYQRTLTGSEIARASDGPLTFRIKIYITDNPWAVPVVTLAESGGVNGLSVAFNGGGDGSTNLADNTIKISSGGANWGSNASTTYTIPWRDNTWYEIVIRDITLQTTGTGESVTGKVDIFEAANPSVTLLSNKSIGGYGQTAGSFDKIDTIFVTASRVIYDDLSLSAVPEPAALGFLGLGLFGALTCSRRKA